MNSLTITLVTGVFAFLSIYLSFGYWVERIWVPMLKARDQLVLQYDDLFMKKTPEAVLRIQLGWGFGFFALAPLLFWPEVAVVLIAGIVFFWIGFNLPRIYLNSWVRPQRVAQFSVQMVDALTLMANGLKSGLNVAQTIQIVVDEMPRPIKEEFGLVLSQNRAGSSLEEAFENLGRRIRSEDVSMFVTSVNILTETGGNIAETFQNITKTIRERIKLQAKIQAMTAQGMASAVIVGMLPWALALMLYLVDPVAMTPLFTTIPGWGILLLVCILEVLGFLVVMKIVKIKV
jgi:tight adherence protein B